MNIKANHIICILISLYTFLIVCMGIATMVEKLNGKECAYETIYGAWWFVGMWIALSLISLVCLIGRKVYRKWAVALLHLSFLVILIGAFITHLTSEEGTIHLRKGVKTSTFTNTRHESLPLPFQLSLEEFRILYYPGTDAVMDYQATMMVDENGNRHSIQVSMNHIGKVSGYRLYQSSYDSDLQGTILLMTHDPYGIPVTYAGYLLLLISLLWIMASRHTRIRHLYQLATKPVAVLLLVLGCSAQMMAQESPRTISKELAHEMAVIPVLYNERICPLNTAATDFVTKLCGKSTWKGMSADEIFIGWMIYYTEWESQPIIKVKSQYVQQILGIDSEWASVRDFYNSQHKYKLRDAVHNTAISESARKALREVDEKIQTVTMFYHSEMLRMFPLRSEGQLKWYTPGSTELPQGVPEAEFQFINHAMDHLVKYLLVGDVAGAKLMMAKIRLYQREKAAEEMPSPWTIRAELFYNRLQSHPLATYLMLALSMLAAVLSLVIKRSRWGSRLHSLLVGCMAVYISMLFFLRWWISGHVPLSNGYETMLFMAWMVMLTSVAMMSRVTILKAFGPVISSLFLLVATFAVGNPQIAHLRPVLQSPLLSVHVAIIMISYTLLALIALLAVYCLCTDSHRGQLTALSRLMLYPAVFALCIGIFVGAVWANISWGTYWSWDPKETWALITLMIYAVPLHGTSLTDIGHPKRYHAYVLVSFLAVVMTYFGVNYYMSGMHSYA